MSETEGDVALRCAFAFVDEMVKGGLEHACVSPGSRSTPIALAFARHPGVRVHVHLDERASAFFALGIGKATHRPAAAVCTSGTAAAEFLPAVVEGSMSRVPLLLLTADRPPELRGVGANQAIDQRRLYGRHARWFVDAPVPGEASSARRWRSLAKRAFTRTIAPPSGPVQVNLPFREPLVPAHHVSEHAFQGRGITVVATEREERAGLLEEIRGVERGVVVAGSLRAPAPSLAALSRHLAWPLIAEPTSGLRAPGALGAGTLLLSNDGFVQRHRPELLLQVGGAATSRPGLAFAAVAGRLVIVDPDDLVADPNRVAAATIVDSPELLARQVLDSVAQREPGAWLREWHDADDRARDAVDGTIDAWDEPFEGRVARDVAECVPDGSTLVVGSSMPVRDLDLYMRPRDRLRVLSNRGASGIDGFVSTTFGVAATGAPTTALCGDLTLLHDVGSLIWNARRGLDAVFVVPNNDGGAIFSFLPQRELPEFEELFATPHGLDLAAVCEAAGAGHEMIRHAGDLVPAIERSLRASGVHVIEVPTDRDDNVRRHAEVHEAVADALRRTM
ncbi:MAG TPA: 2-succinyl-5-enolpyruvyl-6-hydroxy-3-cyclohexene-1-carboxylic-acid synthase [Actinomycetota bacterium]|nr:2-succinyl-5-enolpyruvyl-6-hydroxy-3-cyclohexene-1-carboxylic-acid synthase [Actinomycetota bacterium]